MTPDDPRHDEQAQEPVGQGFAVGSGPVQLIYVNWFRTEGSPGDLAVDIGYQPGNLPPLPAARLAMTWEHARLLRDALTKAIEAIQTDTGIEVRDLEPYVSIGPPRFGPGASVRENGDEQQ
jgi:hypothetical protein